MQQLGVAISPLIVTGPITIHTPLMVVQQLARQQGYREINIDFELFNGTVGNSRSLDIINDLGSLLHLAQNMNSDNTKIDLVTEVDGVAEPHWSNLALLINSEVDWTRRNLLSVFQRLRPYLEEGHWRRKDLEALLKLLPDDIQVGNPTISHPTKIPLFIGYGIARLAEVRFDMTSSVSDVISALLWLKRGHGEILVSGSAACYCPEKFLPVSCIPLAYHPWYHQAICDSVNYPIVEEIAKVYSKNCLYCLDPSQELLLLQQGSDDCLNNRLSLTKRDDWYQNWLRINPDYFNMSLRYDPNLPSSCQQRSLIVERYSKYPANSISSSHNRTLSWLAMREYHLENGPVPGGGPISSTTEPHFAIISYADETVRTRNYPLSRLTQMIDKSLSSGQLLIDDCLLGAEQLLNFCWRYPSGWRQSQVEKLTLYHQYDLEALELVKHYQAHEEDQQASILEALRSNQPEYLKEVLGLEKEPSLASLYKALKIIEE